RDPRQDRVDQTEGDRVDGVDALDAVRQVETVDVPAVPEDLGDDLTETEGDEREVVALEAQRRRADDRAGQGADRRSDRQHEPEVDVDARLLAGRGRAEDVDLPL